MPDDLDLLQLAFAWHAASVVVRADAELDETEVKWVAARFPESRLRDAGLVDAEGAPTARFEGARDRALARLPEALTSGQKLALLETVADASAADGVLTPEEADALSGFARVLGVDDRSWLDHLEARILGGQLRRDDTGV
jgi:hypothetical protein